MVNRVPKRAIFIQAFCADCRAGGVGDMQKGNTDARLDFRCRFVHGVGAEND